LTSPFEVVGTCARALGLMADVAAAIVSSNAAARVEFNMLPPF
jgi:hypothetical protein